MDDLVTDQNEDKSKESLEQRAGQSRMLDRAEENVKAGQSGMLDRANKNDEKEDITEESEESEAVREEVESSTGREKFENDQENDKKLQLFGHSS